MYRIDEDDRVRKEVPKPVDNRLGSSLLFDWEGMPNIDCLKNHFLREGRLETATAIQIVKQVSI